MPSLMKSRCQDKRNKTMHQFSSLTVALGALALVGCSEPAAMSDDNTANVQPVQSSIDWGAAREDLAKREDTGGAQVASNNSLAVPVLLPDVAFGVQTADGEEALKFKPLTDGYYAVARGDAYDMIITGSDKLVKSPDTAVASTEDIRFEETLTGPQISFRRYGASYLVEFSCKGERADGCLTEDEAVAAIQDLLVAGTK